MKNFSLLKPHFFLLLFSFCTNSVFSQVVINEYSASNLSVLLDNYDKYEDWIELYNASTSQIDIGGYYLSDKQDNPVKWQIPDGTVIPSGGFLIFWASGRDETANGHFHTNFKLKQTKQEAEFVVLSTPDGQIIDMVQLEKTRKDHSRGRMNDGDTLWAVFTSPTPGSSNNTANAYSRYAATPVMELDAGFYQEQVSVTIINNEPNSVLRYTTDGSDPGQYSPVYTGPLNISQTTIVKARAFPNSNDILPGFMDFNTYFINANHTLSVMSIASDQLDDLLNGNQSLIPFGTFEYFDKNGIRTSKGYGEFNEHGQDSWVHPQRSIDYISRDECGYDYAIRVPLLPAGLTDRNEYQRIILRAAGDDNYPGIDSSALLRDFFVQNLACKAGMYLDMRRGEKGILYVNGDYWGVYGYREKVSDHDYTGYYYGQDKYNIYYMLLWGGIWAEYGGQDAWDDWTDIRDFILNNNMSDPENFGYVKSKYDYKSLVDYIIINSYVVCSDWINWNVGWWRGLNPEGGHRKWGYILWDEDATFNHYINYTGVPGTSPYVSPCYPEELTNDPGHHIEILNSLLDNTEFSTYYISRYIDLYNTYFKPSYMINYLDSIENGMLPEMQKHIQRWGGSLMQWQNNVQKIRNFIINRHGFLPSGLGYCYDLTGPYELTINAVPDTAGSIQLNSITHTSLPWGGYYFGGVDTKLKAIPDNPNWEFDHWEINNNTIYPNDTTPEITVNLQSGDNIIALFTEKTYNDSLVINEINYNSASDFDTEDWVELYNPHGYQLDISGWMFKDEDDTHIFTFPEGTVLEPSGLLVLCKDTAMFKSFFPDVQNLTGNFEFGLSGGGELIRLFNNEGLLVDYVEYDDDTPWPVEPDGNGPTLELINPAFDNALYQSWAASQDHGTPGSVNSVFTGLNTFNLSLNIYPNPASNFCVIEINGDYRTDKSILSVFNIFGQQVLSFPEIINGKVTLQTKKLKPGIYFVKFHNKKQGLVLNKKLIVR